MSTIMTVTEVSSSPWNQDIAGVAGVLDRIYKPMGGAGWALQNGRLRDPRSGKIIEFMFSKGNFLDEAKGAGKYLRITAQGEGSLVWREQKPKPSVNGGKPFAKLEITAAAKVEVLDENPFEQTAFDLFSQPQQTIDAAAITRTPTSPPISPRMNAKDDHRVSINRLGSLYLLVEKEVLRLAELDRSNEWTEERKKEARGLIYVQATRDGIHHQLNPNEVEIAFNPEAKVRLQPNLHRFLQLVKGREDTITFFLRATDIIGKDENVESLTEQQAARVLALPAFRELYQEAS